MAGQPQPGSNPWLTFDVTNCTIYETGLPPSTVIECTRPFSVDVDFVFAEMLAPWIVTFGVSCEVRVRFESLGTGPEVVSSPTTVTTVAGSLSYKGTVSMSAGTFTPGAYKMVCTVTIPGSPIAGYVEGPIIQMC